MLKVVIVGYGEMFTNLIAGALDANCEIVGVFRNEMRKYPSIIRKIKDILNPSLDYNYIKSYNLPEIYANSVNSKEFKKKLLILNPDIMLIGSWGEKIKKEIYDLPKIATINAHPSLLPTYRGPNPYFWTIKNREQTSGVTFHLVDEGFDTGAILAQEEVKIYPSDTGKTLKERTVLTARGVVCELLKALREDIIIPLQQREDKASYYSYPSGLELDFEKSAEENEALIRAINPWGKAYFYNNGTPLAVKFADVQDNIYENSKIGEVVDVSISNKEISVVCGNNKILKMKVDLYNKFDRFFTKNYLKHDIEIGKIVKKTKNKKERFDI